MLKKFIYLYQVFPLNPKALSLGELYGEFELGSNDWTDGVLSSIARNACNGRFYYVIKFFSDMRQVFGFSGYSGFLHQ